MSTDKDKPSWPPIIIIECCSGDNITVNPEDIYNIFFCGWHDEIIRISLLKRSDMIVGDFDDRDNYHLSVVEVNIKCMTCHLLFDRRDGVFSASEKTKHMTFPIKSFKICRPENRD